MSENAIPRNISIRHCIAREAAVVSFCDFSARSRRWFVAKAARPKSATTAVARATSARVNPLKRGCVEEAGKGEENVIL